MIDIIIVFACALCGFACGKYIEKRIRRKGEFYGDLVAYTAALKINIEEKQVELPQFNENFAAGCSGAFAEYLQTGSLKLHLPEQSRKEIENFFGSLGNSGSQLLASHINTYSAIFTELKRRQYENEVSKAGIYVKLAVLLGVMLGIVLI